jgi:hypothetical protein
MEIDKVAYDTSSSPYRGWHCKATYLKEPKGDALIEIFRDGVKVREFLFPAYKIYNISAHFTDIVDGEMENDGRGYSAAASTGFHAPEVVLEPLTTPAKAVKHE